MDTDITASGVWSSGDGPQETTIPPYPTNLTFHPLTSNTSGEYTLTVTVRPLDNSPFIVWSNGSATYNLVVQRKLGIIISLSFHVYICMITLSLALPFSHYFCGVTSPLP